MVSIYISPGRSTEIYTDQTINNYFECFPKDIYEMIDFLNDVIKRYPNIVKILMESNLESETDFLIKKFDIKNVNIFKLRLTKNDIKSNECYLRGEKFLPVAIRLLAKY